MRHVSQMDPNPPPSDPYNDAFLVLSGMCAVSSPTYQLSGFSFHVLGSILHRRT